jgi:hypothetical protein
MEITGKIIQINPIEDGESNYGKWRKQEFLILTDSQFPKKVIFSLWGEKIKKFIFKCGDKVDISFDLESNESKKSKGKYFLEARAWMVKYQQQPKFSSTPGVITPIKEPIPEPVNKPVYDKNESFDDLPF